MEPVTMLEAVGNLTVQVVSMEPVTMLEVVTNPMAQVVCMAPVTMLEVVGNLTVPVVTMALARTPATHVNQTGLAVTTATRTYLKIVIWTLRYLTAFNMYRYFSGNNAIVTNVNLARIP